MEKKNKKTILAILITLTLLGIFFGCTKSGLDDAKVNATITCIGLCKKAVDDNVSLVNGPCIGRTQTDWVCDVAHSPREAVDNLPANQCADYANGLMHHFVEVDTNCQLISIDGQ
ncbi:Uncharacterised protein [uncultured archaeon]|nr:Uncharacterised protein [uncultured archaeon]